MIALGVNFVQPVRIVAWGLASATVILSLVPAEARPETALPHFAEHFLIYAAVGAAFRLGYNCKTSLFAILFLIFAGCIEIAQLFVPGRHARFSDFVIDVLGMYIGLVAVSLTSRIRTGFGSNRDAQAISGD
jgi:VanZ family protein